LGEIENFQNKEKSLIQAVNAHYIYLKMCVLNRTNHNSILMLATKTIAAATAITTTTTLTTTEHQ